MRTHAVPATTDNAPFCHLRDPPAVGTGVRCNSACVTARWRCRAPFLLFTNLRGSVAQAKATGVTVPASVRSPPRCSTNRCQPCVASSRSVEVKQVASPPESEARQVAAARLSGNGAGRPLKGRSPRSVSGVGGGPGILSQSPPQGFGELGLWDIGGLPQEAD